MPESKRLVIDASVAGRASGPAATDPSAISCRDFLATVLDAGHVLVMTPEIRAEWNEHRSQFANEWRYSMLAHGQFDFVPLAPDVALREQLDDVAHSDGARAAMYKDACLVEAALATDRTVASLDERVRALFRQATEHVGALRAIVWVNPEQEEETPLLWLRNGAPAEPERMLGYAPSA